MFLFYLREYHHHPHSLLGKSLGMGIFILFHPRPPAPASYQSSSILVIPNFTNSPAWPLALVCFPLVQQNIWVLLTLQRGEVSLNHSPLGSRTWHWPGLDSKETSWQMKSKWWQRVQGEIIWQNRKPVWVGKGQVCFFFFFLNSPFSKTNQSFSRSIPSRHSSLHDLISPH